MLLAAGSDYDDTMINRLFRLFPSFLDRDHR